MALKREGPPTRGGPSTRTHAAPHSTGGRSTRGEDTPRNGTRVPPHDLDAETALLGAMLLNRDAARDAADLDPACFYRPLHASIHRAIVALYNLEEPIDVVTVAARVGDELEAAGGKQFLLELTAATPASANGRQYAEIVRAAAARRRTISLAGELADAAYVGLDFTDRAAELLDHVERGAVFSPSTLEVVDLGPILRGETPDVVPFWLHRNDGHALLYPGKLHDLHGEPSHGKTWVALAAVRHVLESGGAAVYVDFEDTPRGIVGRLIALGVDTELVGDTTRFRYVRPASGLGPAELAQLHAVIAELSPDLVVIDGVANALAADGYDENSNPDVVQWAVTVPRPIAAMGGAVVMLDHVTRDPQGRTRGARGAGAKLAIIDGVSYEVRLGAAFSRRREGFAKIIIAKDREGAVGSIGETVAHARIVPRDDGARVGLWLEPPPVTEKGEFKPTGLMARISHHLRDAGTPQGSALIFDIVHGKQAHKRQALALLVFEGFVEEVKEGRRTLYRHVKTYREQQHLTPVDDLPPEPDPDDPGPDEPPELDLWPPDGGWS